jgi:hypothetical protein
LCCCAKELTFGTNTSHFREKRERESERERERERRKSRSSTIEKEKKVGKHIKSPLVPKV